MTEFEKKRFTVPLGSRPPEKCKHEWIDPKGNCVMCGEPEETTIAEKRAYS